MASSLKPEKTERISGAPGGADHRFRLTSLALLLVLIAIVGVGILLAAKDFKASYDITGTIKISNKDTLHIAQSDSLNRQYNLEIIKAVHEEEKDYREFFLKICQMVLLNLLLPILTAILGYKVGTKDTN